MKFLHTDRRWSIEYKAQSPLKRHLLLRAISSQTHPLSLKLLIDDLVDVVELGEEREESFLTVHSGQDIWLNHFDVRLRQLLALIVLKMLIDLPDLLEIHLGVGTKGQLIGDVMLVSVRMFLGLARVISLHRDGRKRICLKTKLVKLIYEACVIKFEWTHKLVKLV